MINHVIHNLFMKRGLSGILLITSLIFLPIGCKNKGNVEDEGTSNKSVAYAELTQKLKKGWNTWDTRNVLTQAYLPDGFALTIEPRVGHKTIVGSNIGVIDRAGTEIIPGGHNYDGSYTDLTLKIGSKKIRVQTVAEDKDIVILITNDRPDDSTAVSIVANMKWGKPGNVILQSDFIEAIAGGIDWTVNLTSKPESTIQAKDGCRLNVSLKNKLGIATNRKLSIDEIEMKVASAEEKHDADMKKYGESKNLYDAMQTVLAWNTIYEPMNDRVITPVSRSWSDGGFVLFEWDTYFACYMLSLDNKDLAYANLIAITKEVTPEGFVPNFTNAAGKSADRSQPPVGSTIIREIYRHYKEKWILEELFPDLLSWNRWWPKYRDDDGYLCWGTNPIPLGPDASRLEKRAVGKIQGAKFESGLDNSPMYDGIPFDTVKHVMQLADVGLMSMYVMDCMSLADIAETLNHPDIQRELLSRAEKYRNKLQSMWNEKEGIYLNRNLATGEYSLRKSPTLFYPLLAKAPSEEQAKRMINEHFYNPDEFWGEWILPSIARNDSAYSNEYWRGRIWGPMNFLVYLGMRNYDVKKARKDLVQKSNALLLKTWDKKRLVHENYNPFTGDGTSDDFYHWGALLGFMKFIENGTMDGPENPF